MILARSGGVGFQPRGRPKKQPGMAMAAQTSGERSTLHSVPEIERALAGPWASSGLAGGGDEHRVAARSSVLNLVVLAGHRETAERCAATIAATASHHPSRSLIVSTIDPDGPPGIDAWIEVLALPAPSGHVETGAETVHIAVHGEAGRHLTSVIVPLLLHDLPVALWWPQDPAFGSHRAERLLALAERLIVDGSSWSGDGLDRLAGMAVAAADQRLVVADFALIRQARWREAVASVYDGPDLRPHLRAVDSITVAYAPTTAGDASGLTNVVRPVYHVAWLASRLGMSVVEPFRRAGDGRREAVLRQADHLVCVTLAPAASDLGPGSTVHLEIHSRTRGMRLVGQVSASDRTVDVVIREDDQERVRRSYAAPARRGPARPGGRGGQPRSHRRGHPGHGP
jgi:glucose-6-phosphate dehydrogenase assembly protein OpcA